MSDLEERVAGALSYNGRLMHAYEVENALAECGVHLVEDKPLPEQGRARRSDPSTSHAAARQVSTNSAVHEAIRGALRNYPVGRTDAGLLILVRDELGLPRLTSQNVRSRRDELVKAGEVRDSGRTAKSPYGRRAILWEYVGG